jgi:hypothetical protein
MKFMLSNRLFLLAGAIVAVAAVGGLAVSLTGGGQIPIASKWSDAESQTGLTKPLRLELLTSNALEEFALGLRAFHYRSKPQGVAVYSDVFYDTPDWRLYRSGYSFRFREVKDDGGEASYSVRLEQEPRFVPTGSKKMELRASLPAAVGLAIAQGAWQQAVRGETGGDVAARLSVVLQTLDISPEEIGPRLAGELRRERFDITDKGQSWFELDHESWTFQPFEDADRRMRFDDIVIDTRLKKSDPELFRRVVTMNRLSHMIYGVGVATRAPHERAIERFGFVAEARAQALPAD